MKNIIPLLFSCILLVSCNQSSLSKEFKSHFKSLDSAAKAFPQDTIFIGQPASISFIEENTGIEGSGDGTYLGKFEFSKTDLRNGVLGIIITKNDLGRPLWGADCIKHCCVTNSRPLRGGLMHCT